jgi:histidinol-phosphate aminotransferase
MPDFLPREHLRPIERTNERHEGRDRFICLDRNERASPFSDALMRRMLAELTSRDLTAYPDAGPLVRRLSAQVGLPEDWICETAGSDAALRRMLMAYLPSGGIVLFANPSYAMYDIYTRIFEGVPRSVEYRPDRSLDIDAMLGAIVPGVQVVIIANPNQPTGTAAPLDALERLVVRAAQVGALCVVDEAYYPFHAETILPLVDRMNNLIVTRTLSKYPGVAGLRLGYAVGAPSLMKGLTAVRGGSEVSGVSLALGCYLLDHPDIAEEFRVAAEAGRTILIEAARPLGFEALPCVANFQLLRAPPGIDADDVAQALKRRGYLVKSGFGHVSMRQCIRISLNGPDIMDPFVIALAAAAEEIQAARRHASRRSSA